MENFQPQLERGHQTYKLYLTYFWDQHTNHAIQPRKLPGPSADSVLLACQHQPPYQPQFLVSCCLLSRIYTWISTHFRSQVWIQPTWIWTEVSWNPDPRVNGALDQRLKILAVQGFYTVIINAVLEMLCLNLGQVLTVHTPWLNK